MKGCFSHRIYESGKVPTLKEIRFAFLTQSLDDGRFLTNLRKERLLSKKKTKIMEKLYCTVAYDDECPMVHHTMAKNKKQAIKAFWKYLEENSGLKQEELKDMLEELKDALTVVSFPVKVGESRVAK